MATKVSQLNEDTSPSTDDYLLVVDNATGTSRKATIAHVVALASAGSTTLSVASKSADYTLTSSDDVVKFTVSGKVLTFHSAVSATAKRYTIQNASSGNISFATTSAQTVNGSTTGTIIPNQSLEAVPDGANWIIT